MERAVVKSKPKKGLAIRLAVAGSSLVVGLLVLELAARLYIANFASEAAFKRYATLAQITERFETLVEPHRYLGYSLTPNYEDGFNRHNSLGFRGEEIPLPKPPGEFRIVCLGGSTTYTLAVKNHEFSYPALLERELHERGRTNVRVVNAGVPGYTSWETLINLQLRVLELEPDLLIVYHAVNDINARFVWPPEAYRSDNSGRSRAMGELAAPGLFKQSALVRMVLVRLGRLESPTSFSNTIDVYPDTYYGEEFMRQIRERRFPSGIFERVAASQMLEANPPVYFLRNLESLISIARDRGIGVLLSTFASSPLFTDRPRASSAEYIAAFAEMNACLGSLASDQGVPLFDFAAGFPQDEDLYTDGRHLTRKGARLKAQQFADYLLSEKLLP